MNSQRIYLLGGDARVPALGAVLSRAGAKIGYYGLRGADCRTALGEALADARAVILPLPCSRDGETLFAPSDANAPYTFTVAGLKQEAEDLQDYGAYVMGFGDTYVFPGTGYYNKYGGRMVRCIAGV